MPPETSTEASPRYLTYSEAMRFSSLSVSTLQRLIREKKLSAAKIGRRVLIDLNDLNRLIADSAVRRPNAQVTTTEPTSAAQ